MAGKKRILKEGSIRRPLNKAERETPGNKGSSIGFERWGRGRLR